MGLSNKILAALVSITMAVMLFSIFVSINQDNQMTGRATSQSATVNITVGSTLEINFTNNAISFGSGAVHIGNDTCLLGTNTTTQQGCSRWESKAVGLVLENIGNTYARINLTNTNYSSSFFAGTDSDKAGYAIIIQTPESNSTTCQGTGPAGSIVAAANHTFYNLTQALNTSNMLCATFNFSDYSDVIQIDFLFAIPNTTNFGSQSDTWTATARAA